VTAEEPVNMEELRCCAGIQFDPKLVELFTGVMGAG
jgi:hypothetical protein